MKRLLEHHVEMLRLREDAPFPRQCFAHREMIKEHQRAKRLRLVAGLDGGMDDFGSDYLDGADLVGEQE